MDLKALVKVRNVILKKMNTQEVTFLVMLVFSAVFDTVNHKILLKRLNEGLGICGVALQWFMSYLVNIGQRVSVMESLSQRFSLDCGVWAPCFSLSMRSSYSRSNLPEFQA